MFKIQLSDSLANASSSNNADLMFYYILIFQHCITNQCALSKDLNYHHRHLSKFHMRSQNQHMTTKTTVVVLYDYSLNSLDIIIMSFSYCDLIIRYMYANIIYIN